MTAILYLCVYEREKVRGRERERDSMTVWYVIYFALLWLVMLICVVFDDRISSQFGE